MCPSLSSVILEKNLIYNIKILIYVFVDGINDIGL